MKVERGYNKDKINEIASCCGSRSVKQSISFLGRMHYMNPEKVVVEVFDGVAFYGANICKKHLRLYEIAVKEQSQRKGYGTAMIMRMADICRQNGLDKITFRTAKNETAVDFYQKIGASIVGEKGEDWEMEILV